MTDVTASRGSVPPSTSQTTGTRTAPSTPASAGATTTTPIILESPSRTRGVTPLVIPSSSRTEIPTAIPHFPPRATPVAQPNDKPAKSSVDYSRLRVADNMSFSEAYAEAVDLNDQSTRLKDDEQAALRSLHMIHNVSSLTSPLYAF